ncbi:hypothetical protein V5799_026565 [Amblyomma americanum]|uniref:Uncharacterized protein n=1 Tax=Amblyomma americanum TaxID=6943 RepID=A0AAQ4DI84_AMBAM
MTLQQVRQEGSETGSRRNYNELGPILKAVHEAIGADNPMLNCTPASASLTADAAQAEEPAHKSPTRPSELGNLPGSSSIDVYWVHSSEAEHGELLFRLEDVEVKTCDNSTGAAAPETTPQLPAELSCTLEDVKVATCDRAAAAAPETAPQLPSELSCTLQDFEVETCDSAAAAAPETTPQPPSELSCTMEDVKVETCDGADAAAPETAPQLPGEMSCTLEDVKLKTCDANAATDAASETAPQLPEHSPVGRLESAVSQEQTSQSTHENRGAAWGKRPATLHQSRLRQHALQLRDVLELNRQNIELEAATLQARRSAAKADLAISTSVAEATAKAAQAATETLGKYAALAHQLGDVAVAAKDLLCSQKEVECSKKKVLDLEARNLELEGRRRLLELENLELEKKRRLLELKKLEYNTSMKGGGNV